MGHERAVPGHVFLSYVREDRAAVDDLHRALDAAGIPVWRDTADLWPGQDWHSEIRRAITDGALVFVACFSSNSTRRTQSYQNEELTLAVEQMRLRSPDSSWLIPVRLNDCVIPDRDIGGGRTLAAIQRTDLFGNRYGEGIARLVAAVLRVLGFQGVPAVAVPQQPRAENPSLPGQSAADIEHVEVDSSASAPKSNSADEWIRAMARKQGMLKPAITDRWRFTYSFADAPAMSQLGNQGFDHHAYSRPPEQVPAWMRIRAMVACELLGEAPGWQELRGKFAGFLTQESVRGLIAVLTDIPDGALWRPRATVRRSWLEADMTVSDESAVPAASAMLFLPEEQGLAGVQPGCAQLTLHVELPVRSESGTTESVKGLPPPYWRARFEQAVRLPGDLAAWLAHTLALPTVERPASQVGIMLQSRQPLTGLIDTSDIRTLPGPGVHSQFTGWAVADSKGKTIQDLASQMMLDLSERVLHLDGTIEQMSGLE